MNKTHFIVAAAVLIAAGCEQSTNPPAAQEKKKSQMAFIAEAPPIPKPTAAQLAEYKKLLGDEAYRVLFEAGTETAFRNAYHDNHAKGTYVSAITGKPLFSSEDKFDSGSGWPSFTKPISEDAVILRPDVNGAMEVIDASSGGHLGHVFDDGPTDQGGQRYCMNSAAMKFVPAK